MSTTSVSMCPFRCERPSKSDLLLRCRGSLWAPHSRLSGHLCCLLQCGLLRRCMSKTGTRCCRRCQRTQLLRCTQLLLLVVAAYRLLLLLMVAAIGQHCCSCCMGVARRMAAMLCRALQQHIPADSMPPRLQAIGRSCSHAMRTAREAADGNARSSCLACLALTMVQSLTEAVHVGTSSAIRTASEQMHAVPHP